ncbi:MAG: TetR/AcrR family transcriptional regulator [Pirellulales bacterium]|nr:TetR/AcrR family transcriptional regulator [Pirellulales bacterium]
MAEDRSRDADATRQAVLRAAERLFAEQGFAATSVRDISAASGVSHPLILHHFGSKDELYSAVKRRLVEGYAHRFPQAARAMNRPLNIPVEMRRIMDYIGENPMLLKLCARTRLENDFQVWPGEPDILNTLRRRIEVSQRRKLIRDDLDPRYLSIMVLGLVYFWLEGCEHFAQRFDQQVNAKDYLRQAIAVLEQGLAANADDCSLAGDPSANQVPV